MQQIGLPAITLATEAAIDMPYHLRQVEMDIIFHLGMIVGFSIAALIVCLFLLIKTHHK